MLEKKGKGDEKLISIGGNSTLLSFRVPAELYNALRLDAEKKGVTLTEIVRERLTVMSFPTLIKQGYVPALMARLDKYPKGEDVPPEALKDVIDFFDNYFQTTLEAIETLKAVEATVLEDKSNFDEAKKRFSNDLERVLKTFWDRGKKPKHGERSAA